MIQTANMQAAITNFQSELAARSGLTSDQAIALIGQALTPLQTQIQTILASEQTDEAKLSDVTAAVTEFTTAFAPATPATPAPDSVAPAPAPTPAPAPAPDSVAPAPAPEAAPAA